MTPNEVLESDYCEADLILRRLPSSNPDMYDDLFSQLEDKDDEFVSKVLAKAVLLKPDWRKYTLLRSEVLDLFLRGKRGASVFAEWLRIPYVRSILAEMRPIEVSGPHQKWKSIAHALADFKQCDSLNSLLETFEEYKNLKVASFIASING